MSLSTELVPQFDFLHTYISMILDDQGLNQLTEDVRNQYLPQLVAEAERRIGLAVLPLLSERDAKELAELLEDDPDPLRVKDFWQRAVPHFEQVVSDTLQAFGQEMKEILAVA